VKEWEERRSEQAVREGAVFLKEPPGQRKHRGGGGKKKRNTKGNRNRGVGSPRPLTLSRHVEKKEGGRSACTGNNKVKRRRKKKRRGEGGNNERFSARAPHPALFHLSSQQGKKPRCGEIGEKKGKRENTGRWQWTLPDVLPIFLSGKRRKKKKKKKKREKKKK